MEAKQQLLEVVRKSERDRCEYLNALFKYVPDAVVRAMSYKVIQKDQCLIYEGTPCDTVYFVLSGHVAGMDFQKQGRVYYFMDFTQMHVVGDFEVFGGIPQYCVTIRAMQECRILALSSGLYLEWVQNDENALLLRIKNIVSTLMFEKKNEREFMFMNCKERLVKYLVQSYENEMPKRSGGYKVQKTQLELSERIGFNIRSVQRNIAALEREGLVSNENGKITISHEQFLCLKEYEGQ